MRFLAFAAAVFMSAQASAMPCDGSFQCKSASGKYNIEISRCRYDNHLRSIEMLKINGADVTDAQLGAAFDGEDFGGFEIELAQKGETQRVLSVEWAQKTGKGIIRDKSRDDNPAPYKTSFSEAISCKDEG
jgi:hypothetical protein